MAPDCVKVKLPCQLCSGFAIIVAEMNMKVLIKHFLSPELESPLCHFNLSFLDCNKMSEQRRLIILIIKAVKPRSF